MSRQGPAPSPLPRWEALKEPTQASSSDEESENTTESIAQNAERPTQPLKRKDNDRSSALASVAKRPRHELERREGQGSAGGSASAPGPSSSSRPSSSQAGPSRIPNRHPNSSISAGPPRSQASSSVTRKVDASQDVASVSRPKPRPKPPRSQYISVFSSSEKDDEDNAGSKKAGKSSLIRHGFSSTLSKGKKPASQVNKSTQNEIIEISSDSESEPPARISKPKSTSKPSKPSDKPSSSRPSNKPHIPPRARKTTGNFNKSQPVKNIDREIIVITDSDDEPPRLPSRLTQSVREPGPSTSVKEKVSMPPPSQSKPKEPVFEQAMEIDREADVGGGADMEVDQVEDTSMAVAPSPITSAGPSAAARPPSAGAARPPVDAPRAPPPHPVTPPPSKSPQMKSAVPKNIALPPSPSTSAGPSAPRISSSISQSSAKKPTFSPQSHNPLPAPPVDDDVPPPSPPKRRLMQSGIKTASLNKRISPSTSSGDDSDSEHSQSATGSGQASSAAEEGIDMRNLSDALEVAVPSAQPRAPEPAAPEPAAPEPAVPEPAVQRNEDRPRHKLIQLARKSTGGVPPGTHGKVKQSARKTMGGIATSSLAEAITSAGQLNASYRHRKGGSIPSANALISEHREPANPLMQHAKASSSKVATRPSLMSQQFRDAGSSSAPSAPAKHPALQIRPVPSRSDTDELLLRPSEPSPPASPSPALQTPSIPGVPPPSGPLPTETETSSTVRRRSAPSLGDAPTPTPAIPPRPSASVLQSSGKLASAPTLAGASVQVRPVSMDSVPLQSKAEISKETLRTPTRAAVASPPTPLVFPNLPTPQRRYSPPIPSSLPDSPSEPHPPASSSFPFPRSPALKSPISPKSSKLPQAPASPSSPIPNSNFQSFLDEFVLQSVQEIATNNLPTKAPESAEDDVDMGATSEGRASLPPPQSEYSDDEAMEDAAEVEALIEEGGMDLEASDNMGPGDEFIEDPVLSGMTRRSSRMSSRSSTSENWPASADDAFDSLEDSRQTTPEDGIFVHRGKTYGGFEAITWPGHVKKMRNMPPKCDLAADIPHLFEDHVNDMTWYTRMMPEMRKVYEARILENTVEDEPDAPPIEIQNDVDEEATPPWEFFYSNKMWHGEGVPLPDTKSLVRCNCKGVCSPKSKTCACLKRQREACQDPTMEFAYDKTGKLKIPGYPIFECNDLCGCGDECRNRVVQHGRKVSVAIRKTVSKGWGVFATKKILAGSFIGIYSGELITDVVAQKRGVKYNKFGRTYLFDIDFHHLKDSDDPDWTNKFTVDAYHAGNFTRFLNHSCDPNSRLFACYVNEGNIQKPLLVIFSLRDIEPEEEICFNYNGDYPDDDDYLANKDNSKEEPHIEGARDIIYERCMCGAYNCTGVMFK